MAFEDYLTQRLANRYGQVADEITRLGTTVFNPAAPRTPDYGLPQYGTEANVTPKSTTITYNPDGTQTITNKEEVTPGQPGMMPQPTAVPQPGMMQTQAPAPTQMPPQIFSDIRGQEQDLVGMRQPTAPVAPMPMQPQAQVAPAPVAPVAPGQMSPEPQPQPVQTQAPAATTPPATTAPATVGTTPYADRLSTAVATQTQNPQQSLKDLQALIYDPQTPNDIRQAALQNFADISTYNQNMRKAEAQFNEMMQDPNGMLKIDREIKRSKEDGSYLKAYIYSRLGLNELSVSEQRKLGAGQIWQPGVLEGKNVSVKYDQNGLPIDGFDEEGKALTNKQLAKVGVMAAPRAQAFTASAEVYTTPDGKQQVRQQFNSYTGRTQWIDVKTGQPWSGEGTPTPQRVTTQNMIQMNELQNKLAYAPLNKRLEIIAESEAKYGPLDPQIKAQILAQPTNVPAPGTVQGTAVTPPVTQQRPQAAPPAAAPAPAPAAAPAPATRPITAPAVEEQPQMTQALFRPGPAPEMIQTQAPAGVMPGFPGQRDIAVRGAEKEATTVGEDVGKIRNNIKNSETKADYLITKMDQLVAHPGFKKAVGVYNSDFLGTPIPFGAAVAGMIPGTDVTNFNKRFGEVKSSQFLIGIEQLKGFGALSDAEGQAAKEAVARMDTAQSEAEFKQAVEDFQNVIKRGIDISRGKIGQKPKYGVPAESEMPGAQPAPAAAPVPQSPADFAKQEMERRRREKRQ